MCGRVPGLPPVPWHVGHAASEVSRSDTVTPSSASVNEMVVVVLTVAPRRGARLLGLGALAAPEEVTEHVAEATGPPVAQQVVHAEPAAAEPTAAAAHARAEAAPGLQRAELVVLGALGLVADDVVGLGEPGLESGWFSRASLR